MEQKREYGGYVLFLAVGIVAAIFSGVGIVVNWGKKFWSINCLVWLTAAVSLAWLVAGWKAAKSVTTPGTIPQE